MFVIVLVVLGALMIALSYGAKRWWDEHSRFTRAAFGQVQVGMTPKQVQDLLGTGSVHRQANGDENWIYTEGWSFDPIYDVKFHSGTVASTSVEDF
jgi:SmpA / OmlA family